MILLQIKVPLIIISYTATSSPVTVCGNVAVATNSTRRACVDFKSC